MLAPYRWICDYAEIESDAQLLAEKMIMTGNGVEGIESLGGEIENVVAGKIESIEKHPDADRLLVCMIDVGDAQLLQIVTGADNVFTGAYVPVAKAPAKLPSGPIKKGKLRGVESFGMLCSGTELNLTEADYEGAEVDGILILKGEPQPGADIKELLALSGEVIEFEVGANRPDCLSILGVAREAAAADNGSFGLPGADYDESDQKTEDYIGVDVLDEQLCPRFVAAAVTDVTIGPSPEWMRTRLKEAGIRPINNIVDITNFVMLETGQPMHAYDAEFIRGKKIIVRRAKDGEKMKTLDDKERVFNKNMLLICDTEGPIGVAGVMGGQDSEIKETTQTVIFEAAKFMYGNIRQTSRALGLATESSMRFSKGVDAATTMFAMKRALTLAAELGAGKPAQGMVDVLSEDLSPKIIKTTAAKINGMLGTALTVKEMQQQLNRVYINTGTIGDELVCTVPSFRGDISGPADIAEEVARMYGYDNIEPTSAQGDIRPGKLAEGEAKTDTLKKYLTDIGFFECQNYSFAGRQDYEKLGVPMPKSVQLMNPLGDDTAYMRTSLLPRMLDTAAFNINHKNAELALFEAGRVFIPKEGEALPDEIPNLILLVSGSNADFFYLKGVLENIVQLVSGADMTFKRTSLSFLHPGISADIWVGQANIGYIGALHPAVQGAFGISQQVFVANIDLQLLYAVEKPAVTFRLLPKYPAATRDIALIVDEGTGAGDMMAAIYKAGGKRVESVKIFDVYTGGQVGAGKKSVAYSLVFRAADGTLKDGEVEKMMGRILKTLEQEFSAVLRD
ncbi:MAG: phenylalanine--tRNA ligase subunit beta [Christensenellaceae bacterium]|jgi:phenylalanyl-tRNA synthetase beta chain